MAIVNGNDGPRDLLVVWAVDLCGPSVVLDGDGGRVVGEAVDFEGLVVRGALVL